MRTRNAGLVAAVLIALSPHPAWGAWKVSDVDIESTMGFYSSVAVDVNLFPHVFYTNFNGNGLYHSWFSETGWHREQLDKSDGITFVSAALTADDRPCIAFADRVANRVTYLEYWAGRWCGATIPDVPGTPCHPSLALDRLGRPHIACMGFGEVLYHSWRDADSNWHTEVVDRGPYAGWTCSLALDSAGRPHIAHAAYASEADRAARRAAIRYASRDAAGWRTTTVTDNALGSCSLGLDRDGLARICYITRPTGGTYALVCSAETTRGFLHRVIDQGTAELGETALRVGPGAWVQIAYSDATNGDLKYAVYNGTGWRTETVDSRVNVGQNPSLFVDPKGYTHFSYFDRTDLRLRYATNLNHAPTVTDAALSPESPAPGAPLTMTVNAASDQDRDALTYEYVWTAFIGGRWTTPRTLTTGARVDTLPAGSTARGQHWQCTVRAFDGLVYSVPLQCNVTIP